MRSNAFFDSMPSLIGVALLASCSGSQPSISAPTAMSQVHAIASASDRVKSWMLPEAKNNDLLYVSDPDSPSVVYVYSFPRGRQVGELSGFASGYSPWGLCTDKTGDVFVTTVHTSSSPYDSLIYEYAHGVTTSNQTLTIRDGHKAAQSILPLGI
jgi:hypothetical protein